MNVIIRTPALSMQADAYFINNPNEITNAHTIKSDRVAANVLNLTSRALVYEVKELIRGVDFTFVSTNDLARIGSRLNEIGLIQSDVACIFISGNMATDVRGQQTGRDVKYNAVAMFNQMLDENRDYANAWPMYAHQESFKVVTNALLGANQAISALSYFAHSGRQDLSVSEYA